VSEEEELIERLYSHVDDRLYAIPGQWVCDVNELINVIVAIKNQRDNSLAANAIGIEMQKRTSEALRTVTAERDRLRAVLDWVDEHVPLKEQHESKWLSPTSAFYGVVNGFHGSLEDAANDALFPTSHAEPKEEQA
jgi:hypothetical protein